LFKAFSTLIFIVSETDLCPERTREKLEIATPAWAATSSIRTLATFLDFKTLPFAGLSSFAVCGVYKGVNAFTAV
jgi:hypothetical protein